ncbi:hypothetical protein HPB47_026528, partial [Ixodes persulcatus]
MLGASVTRSVVYGFLLMQLGIGASEAALSATREVIFSPDAPKPIHPYSVGTLEASLDGSRQVITSPLVARPSNPYSHAICVGNTMYLSGQLGSHPQTGRIVPGGIVPETRQALTNLANILDAGQMTLRDVVKVNVYIADMQDYEAMNRIYAEFFTEKYPARVTIRAAEIPG